MRSPFIWWCKRHEETLVISLYAAAVMLAVCGVNWFFINGMSA